MRPTEGNFTLLNSEEQPIWFVTFFADSIKLEFESLGSGEGPDIEAVESVSITEFSQIRDRFGFENNYPIRWVFEDLSAAGRGQELKDYIRENVELKSEFVWFSFPDDF
jgi:hypothetical protein